MLRFDRNCFPFLSIHCKKRQLERGYGVLAPPGETIERKHREKNILFIFLFSTPSIFPYSIRRKVGEHAPPLLLQKVGCGSASSTLSKPG